MKGTIAISFAVLGLALALGGCPPAEEGTAVTGTSTTMTAEVGGGAATATAPTTAATTTGTTGAAAPDATVMADCLVINDKVFVECAADIAPVLVESRIKAGTLPADAVEKVKTPEGKAAVVATALAELKTDSAEPKRTEFCTMMASTAAMVDMHKADKAASDACMAKADCKERVACWTPILDKHMAAMKDKMGAAPAAAPASGAPAAH